MSAARDLSVHPFSGLGGLLGQVGRTPLVRLRDSVAADIPSGVEIWVKCEWFNPGGSVKDRPALSMVLDAERRGRLRPGMTMLDASSGNTGIAYAMIAAARKVDLVLCLPRNANAERRSMLQAYGATVELTDPLEGSDGAIRRARELATENPEWVYLDQYNNPANWQAHVATTGPEIWEQTQGRVTHFVAAVGTSGTLMGVTRYLRTVQPRVVCVEVQPDAPFHGLEGLKHMATALVPGIYSRDAADLHLGAPTEASFAWMRRLAADGLLVGPSGGAAVWAAVQVARRLEHGVVVAMLPDSGRRYLSDAHLWEVPS